MSLRIRRGVLSAGHDSSSQGVVEELPWDSVRAAQAAFDAAPREPLAEEEIETLLRWQAAAESARVLSRRRRSVRSPNYRLYPETLERRDVPTPAFGLTLLAVSLPPAVAAWNDEQVAHETPGETACFSAERGGQRVRTGIRPSETNRNEPELIEGEQGLPESDSLQVALAEGLGAWDDYNAQPNDWALIELLATSSPSNRYLEPLGWCA